MHKTIVRFTLLILACAQIGACQDRREPAKPVVPAAPALAASG